MLGTQALYQLSHIPSLLFFFGRGDMWGSPGWPQTLAIAKDDLEFLLLLPLLPSSGVAGVLLHRALL